MGKSGDIVKGVYDAFARGDGAAVLGALDPQAEWWEAEGFLYADGNPYKGPAGVGAVFQRIGADMEQLTVTVQQLTESGEVVVTEGRYRATLKATGKRVDAQFAHVWRLRNGKVLRFQQYTDTKRWAEAAAR